MVLILRKEIVRVARQYVGTPVRHQGRMKGIAIDCIGLVSEVAKEVGYDRDPPEHYTTAPSEELMLREVEAKLEKQDRPIAEAAAGDIVMMWGMTTGRGQHFGFIAEEGGRLTLIHALKTNNAVVEHGFDRQWLRRAMGLYVFPGTEPV